MTINFVCNPVFINGGWSPWDKRIGGTEECIVEWSRRLAERGNEVTVYHNGQNGAYKGVEFKDRRDYLLRSKGITVNINYPDLKPQEPTIYWTSLTSQGGRDLSAFKEVLVISEYARNNTGIDHPVVSVLSPGYDPQQIKPGNKIPRTVLYASSPDRGLDNLLKVWPDVVKIYPDAQLIVTYGADLGDTPNAICLGEVTEDEMNQLYAESDIWCHPANGGELYCMTGIKAQVARCWPVYFPVMALAETVRFGTKSTPKTLRHSLEWALQPGATDTWRKELPKQFKDGKRIKDIDLSFPTWESTTNQLEAILSKYT